MSFALRFHKMFMRRVLKPRFRKLTDISVARRELALAAKYIFRPAPFAHSYWDRVTPELSCLWVETRPASRPAPRDKVILFFHGGGFVAGSPAIYQKFLSRLSHETGLRICAPDYRKGPEHKFPAAVDDVVLAYRALLAKGYLAENIIVGGDSAGGGLCFSLLGGLGAEGPKPRAIFTFSPIVDLRFTSKSFEENLHKDPLLPSDRRDLVIDNYLGDADPADPAASPILYDLADPPPAFFQFSTTEILRDESLRMAEKLKAAGGEVVLDEWPDCPHVWVLLDGWMPESRQAIRNAARFITQQFHDETQGES